MYTLADNVKTNIIKMDAPIKHVRIDYKFRKIMVSTPNKVHVIFNGNVVEEFCPSLEGFHYLFPLYGIYFATTYQGTLHWSSSYKFEQYQSYSLFTQSPFYLICRNSYLLAYSSF